MNKTDLLSFSYRLSVYHLPVILVCRRPCASRCEGIHYHISSPSRTLLPTASTMSSTTAISPSISTFQLIFNTALKAYEKRTKTDILAHPLVSQLQACNSPASILDVLQGQVDDLAQTRTSDERLTKWLSPTINVLLVFSGILGGGVSLVRVKAISSLGYILTADTGFLTCVSDLRGCRRPSPGLYLSRHLAIEVDSDVLRLQRMLVQPKRP